LKNNKKFLFLEIFFFFKMNSPELMLKSQLEDDSKKKSFKKAAPKCGKSRPDGGSCGVNEVEGSACSYEGTSYKHCRCTRTAYRDYYSKEIKVPESRYEPVWLPDEFNNSESPRIGIPCTSRPLPPQLPKPNKKWPCIQAGGYLLRGYDLARPNECLWHPDLPDADQVTDGSCRTKIAQFTSNYQNFGSGALKWWASPDMCNVKMYAPGAELPPPPVGSTDRDLPLNYDDSPNCSINPYGPNCLLCQKPFALSPKCVCNPDNKYYDKFAEKCSILAADACVDDNKGPMCPGDCEEVDPSKLKKTCYCHPDNPRFFLVKPQCIANAKRQQIDFEKKVLDMRIAEGTLNETTAADLTYTQTLSVPEKVSTSIKDDRPLVMNCSINVNGPGCGPNCSDFGNLARTCVCHPQNGQYERYKAACANMKAGLALIPDCTDPLLDKRCICNPENPKFAECPAPPTAFGGEVTNIATYVGGGIAGILILILLIWMIVAIAKAIKNSKPKPQLYGRI